MNIEQITWYQWLGVWVFFGLWGYALWVFESVIWEFTLKDWMLLLLFFAAIGPIGTIMGMFRMRNFIH